jgi:hypothetical protein
MNGKAYPKEWIISILCPKHKNKGNLESLTLTKK